MVDKNKEKQLLEQKKLRDELVLREEKEIYDLPKAPVVSLPTFVAKRIEAALELEADAGLTLEGAFLFVLGETDNCSMTLANDIETLMPKMTQEFLDWRDDRSFNGDKTYHIIKIMLALIYNYKPETKVHTNYELSLFNDRKEGQANGTINSD